MVRHAISGEMEQHPNVRTDIAFVHLTSSERSAFSMATVPLL
jgi:hypothetical protein